MKPGTVLQLSVALTTLALCSAGIDRSGFGRSSNSASSPDNWASLQDQRNQELRGQEFNETLELLDDYDETDNTTVEYEDTTERIQLGPEDAGPLPSTTPTYTDEEDVEDEDEVNGEDHAASFPEVPDRVPISNWNRSRPVHDDEDDDLTESWHPQSSSSSGYGARPAGEARSNWSGQAVHHDDDEDDDNTSSRSWNPQTSSPSGNGARSAGQAHPSWSGQAAHHDDDDDDKDPEEHVRWNDHRDGRRDRHQSSYVQQSARSHHHNRPSGSGFGYGGLGFRRPMMGSGWQPNFGAEWGISIDFPEPPQPPSQFIQPPPPPPPPMFYPNIHFGPPPRPPLPPMMSFSYPQPPPFPNPPMMTYGSGWGRRR